jgi:hypothetical protein
LPESSKCCKLPTSLLLYRDERHLKKKKKKRGEQSQIKGIKPTNKHEKEVKKISCCYLAVCVFQPELWLWSKCVVCTPFTILPCVSLSLEYRSLSLFSPDCTFGWSKKTPQRVTRKENGKLSSLDDTHKPDIERIYCITRAL